MIKVIKEKKDLSLDKLSSILEKPPTDVFVSVYTKKKVEVGPMPSKDQVTLKQVVDMIKTMDTKMDAGFKQVNTRIDNLEKDINARLDYIISANNLKDLPKSK